MVNPKSKINILITGACGVTSRSVARSLMMSDKFKNCVLIGTDVCYNSYGLYEGLYKKIYKVPLFRDADYRSVMEKIIKNERIDVAIIIPEPEVLYWSENPFNVKFLMTPPKFSRVSISKKRLYEVLAKSGLVPKYQTISKDLLISGEKNIEIKFPLWVRDHSEGSTSGTGSFMPENYEQLKAWLTINPQIENFMLSEYLPGKNYGCFLLYQHDKLLKAVVMERLTYFMSKVSVSGITGNASEGKLTNNKLVIKRSDQAVRRVCERTNEKMNGLVAVDSRENSEGIPYITEINIRHIAPTSSVAMAGFNLAEYQLLCALGRSNELSQDVGIQFPPNNIFLRDIDGLPVYVEDFRELGIGEKR